MSADRPDLAPLIDHALLDPHHGSSAVRQCCEEARHFGFAGVCVASRWVASAREQLPLEGKGASPQLIAVVGFPFGAVPAAVKLAEAVAAAEAGADELDVVPDFGALADRQSTPIHDELAAICELGLPVKVILEVGRLDPDALALLVEISIDAGARFLKSGSGFGPAVTVDHIEQLRQLARGRAAIKASGGIANLEHALALVEAGATRLGTSRGVALAQAMRG
ncbi:deoxyribose-phosphate aldolase [Cyanobium sp. A1C-AMD]|uniref:deoxyribose-phosphate aldolase n=1 Tax=unclassified Cyanobium TaxID=2627006 RepID=UPI0020CBADD7|nr:MULTISPECIES: deoxyribose-phosphate aldolase [unclassified Cyanobium]MCP9778720.1 deoxyribose-phosphate aldolase [Cyanobium sp. Tous-M-B4]MCP9822591.1 deoxyribose-phosphate aldolase [Cyanobium sp. L1E-Cus]MCP9877033.1 deoxyribose-phosphate aldolase [Cyanobium sp. A2C-AMD]MCP9879890.1 deoxyribose-phosphate aldolase [Cyanobium sp. A1C-AMD]